MKKFKDKKFAAKCDRELIKAAVPCWAGREGRGGHLH